MKNIILLLVLMVSTVTFSQQTYVSYGSGFTISPAVLSTYYFDIDQDGDDDLAIKVWSDSITAMSLDTFSTKPTFPYTCTGAPCGWAGASKRWRDGYVTHDVINYYYGISAIPELSDSVNVWRMWHPGLGLGCYRLMFRINHDNGDETFGYFSVYVSGSSTTFYGYDYNPTPMGSCIIGMPPSNSPCYASVDETELDYHLLPYEYYNLMGQKIEHPQGLVLKVYLNGKTEKVWKDY